MPNWNIFSREASLYADVLVSEEGELSWNSPEALFSNLAESLPTNFDFGDPLGYRLCQAMRDFGVFDRQGLDIVSSVWDRTDFASHQAFQDARS